MFMNEMSHLETQHILDTKDTLKFTYVNWKGNSAIRNVGSPMTIDFMKGDPEFYPEQQYQWFLTAFDFDKQDYRSFALNKIEIDLEDF